MPGIDLADSSQDLLSRLLYGGDDRRVVDGQIGSGRRGQRDAESTAAGLGLSGRSRRPGCTRSSGWPLAGFPSGRHIEVGKLEGQAVEIIDQADRHRLGAIDDVAGEDRRGAGLAGVLDRGREPGPDWQVGVA